MPRRLRPLALAVLLAACTPYPDTPEVIGGRITLKTYGDMATASTRARLACGEPKRLPGLMGVQGKGTDETATFNCM